MDQEVRGEGGGTFECLPTHLALKTSFLLGKESHGMFVAARQSLKSVKRITNSRFDKQISSSHGLICEIQHKENVGRVT